MTVPALTGPVVVTGTDTGIGKTITTAAIAAAATTAGHSVTMLKPAQTGDDDDAATVAELANPHRTETLRRYPDPLAPLAAARRAGADRLPMEAVLTAVTAANDDVILIEGAGGLLVPMGEDGWTVADLCQALSAPAVVVARAGLGTLNHTALTLEALARRDISAHVVIGSWPTSPGLAEQENLTDLPGPLAGILPEVAGSLPPDDFRAAAPTWLTPPLHGRMRSLRHDTFTSATV